MKPTREIVRCVCLWACLCLLLFAASSRAQTTTATVSGLITDPNGAVVPGASISFTNLNTGIIANTTSDSSGLYRIASLLPGNYRASVTKQGFKNVLKTNIQLHVEDQISLNFSLQVGSVVESISVEATEPLLQSTSATLSQVIEGATVQNAPLNGRNVMNLVALTPGVVAQGASSGSPLGNQGNGGFTNPNGWGNYQIGGGFGNQSATYMDGAPLNSSYVNSVVLVPTQDAIQEFRVAENAVSPEYGRFAGGVINLSTKAGTNAFHGSVYEYLRNKVLNANYFFNNRNGIPRSKWEQNQYGADVGGPILKDKAFFFFSWEGFALRTGTPGIASVPTDAMRSGDLSGLGVNIYDPYTTTSNGSGGYTRTQLSCTINGTLTLNAICPSRFDATSAAFLKLFPEPNIAGLNANNYAYDVPSGGNYNQYNVRIDYTLSDKQRLFGRYTDWRGDNLGTNVFHNALGQGNSPFATHQLVLGDTYSINSTTVANLRLSYLRFIFDHGPLNTGQDVTPFGPAYVALAKQLTFKQFPAPTIVGMYSGANQDLTILNTSDNYVLSGSVMKVLGRHSLEVGGELRKIEWFYAQDNYGGGIFNFDNGFTSEDPTNPGKTGNPFASFLLGTAASGYVVDVNRTSALQWYGAAYVNDTFQATSRLTVTAGLRWEQPGSFYERMNRLNVLLPNATDPLSTSTGLKLTGQVALVNTPAYPHRTEQLLHWDLFSPRMGVVYHATPTIVVRSGFGLSYLPNDVAFAVGPWNSPVNQSQTNVATSLDGGLTPNNTFSNPFPNGIVTPIGNDVSRLNLLEGGTPGATLPDQTYPYVMQWNLSVEKGFGSKSSLQVGYAGAKGNHLPLYLLNMNQLPDQYDSMGAALLNSTPNPFYGKLPATSGTLAVAQNLPAGLLLKPHPQFLGFSAWGPQVGNSHYNSLQATFQRQFGVGGMLMAAYTWSKLISDVDTLTAWLESTTPGGQYGTQDAYNRKADKSLSANDVPQHLVVSYVLDVPVGTGKWLLPNSNRLTESILGGWSVNGITTLQSGQPLALGALPTTLSNYFGAGGPRPNVVPGCQKTVSGPAQARLGEWFNTSASCWSQPNTFGFGNESREDSALRSAGIANWDFGLYKTLSITERVKTQFQAQVFNLANRVQFGPPGTTLGTPQFGVVTSQVNQPRLYQFSLRVNY